MNAYNALASSYDRLTNDVDYQAVIDFAHEILKRTDRLITEENGQETEKRIREANEDLAAMIRRESADVLGKVLYETSNRMRNCYARSDA